MTPSVSALAHRLSDHVAEGAPGLLEGAGGTTGRSWMGDSRTQWEAGKERAHEAAKGGGKQARTFSKGPKETPGPVGARNPEHVAGLKFLLDK